MQTVWVGPFQTEEIEEESERKKAIVDRGVRDVLGIVYEGWGMMILIWSINDYVDNEWCVDQLETSPAGIVLVMVWRGWNPNSSAGIPNCTNFA